MYQAPQPASELYQPTAPNQIVDEPVTPHYEQWGYSIGYELGQDGLGVPENGNTAIFRIAPLGLTEPVFVTKPEDEATFTVKVLAGNGMFIRANKAGEVDQIPLEKGVEVVVHPGEAYSYKNTSENTDLVLYDVALPAFNAGDDVEITSSRLDKESPTLKDGYAACVVETSDGSLRTIQLPHAFFDAMAEALK